MKWSMSKTKVSYLTILAGLVAFSGCSDDKTTTPELDNIYVGSQSCATCHADLVNQMEASGHPHKLNAVVDGKRPDDHRLTLPENPPAGLAWDDIAFVLGGYGWKVRFITGEQGDYKVVVGEDVQWNIPTEEWVDYHVGNPTDYNFGCFVCHTTGPDEATNTFAEPGVTCEACHGPGNLHILDAAENPNGVDMSLIRIDTRGEACGSCHNRGGIDAPAPASGGFIRHHEQFNEMQSGGHKNLDCGACHDPHIGTRGGQVGGIVQNCVDCHSDLEQHSHPVLNGQPTCVDCHMPWASKSAVKFHEYKGDVRSHIFKLHVGAEGKDAMWDDNGALKRDFGATLDFACYQCHKDENGVGGEAGHIPLQELAEFAMLVHPGNDANAYIGSTACGSCHADQLGEVRASGHPHKLNAVVNGERPTDPLLTLPENPPAGLVWDDIAFVLGGFGWKVRFITGEEGNYNVVVGEDVQWNIPTEEWVDYHVDRPTAYNYGCFVCHTTGPDEATNTFAEPGVSCEACHGPGRMHAITQNPADIVVDTSGEQCGSCHNRNGIDAPAPASGGFIRHHEQYNEMRSAGHKELDCILCHDAHVGIRKQEGGIARDCGACHSTYPDMIHAGRAVTVNCEDCHMPAASKSAVKFHEYKGDVASHIFKIHVGPESKDAMFEGGATLKDDFGTTLDFSCYGCHQDENGVGGDDSVKTREELAAAAANAHGTAGRLIWTR